MRHLRQLATVLGLAALLAALAVGPVSGSYPGRHNGRIAVGVRANGAANIVAFNPDGSGMRQLTSGPGFKLCPTYSPDGRTIAYCGTAGDAFEIWTMKQNGTEQRQLTHLGGFATFPDFSPRTCTAAACFPSTKARTASTRRSRWDRRGPAGPNWLGSGLGSLWVGIPNTGSVVRFAPGTGTVEAEIPAPAGTVPCGGFAVGVSAVWIPSCDTSTRTARIDPASNTAVATVEMGGTAYNPTLIGDAPWISVDRGSSELGLLMRIDPVTNTIDRVLAPGPVFGGGGDIVVADGSVWVSDGWNSTVLRLPLTAFEP